MPLESPIFRDRVEFTRILEGHDTLRPDETSSTIGKIQACLYLLQYSPPLNNNFDAVMCTSVSNFRLEHCGIEGHTKDVEPIWGVAEMSALDNRFAAGYYRMYVEVSPELGFRIEPPQLRRDSEAAVAEHVFLNKSPGRIRKVIKRFPGIFRANEASVWLPTRELKDASYLADIGNLPS